VGKKAASNDDAAFLILGIYAWNSTRRHGDDPRKQ
jgi:hypothetical protein